MIANLQSLVVPCFLCVSVACAAPEPGTPRVVKTKTGVEMVPIPAGSSRLGSPAGPPDESPVHEVRIDSFFIDRCEVTQEQYRKLVGENPSSFPGPGNPVETVGWNDAVTYCNIRSRAEGLKPCYTGKGREWTCDFSANGYRLPTEAEWEYACRAGTQAAYCFGSGGGSPARLRVVRGERGQEDASRRAKEAQRVGALRHARKRE